MWNLKKKRKKQANKIKTKQTHRYREQINGSEKKRVLVVSEIGERDNCMVTYGN